MDRVKDVLKDDKLEELLVANWTKFLDSQKVMAFVLQNVRDRIESFACIPSAEFRNNGVRVTLSRFQIVPNGFIVWVEFTVPTEDSAVAIGTTELHLTNVGDISHIQTLGNIYRHDVTQRPTS